MKKERWFNYRPLCLAFVMLLLGSIFAFYCFFDTSNNTQHYLPMTLSLVGLLVVICVVIIFTIRNKNLKFLILPLVCLIIGGGALSICLTSFNSKNISAPTQVNARIYMITNNGGYQTLYADNVYFDGIKINGKVMISLKDYTYQFDDIEIGRQIKFSPLSTTAINLLEHDTPSANYFKNNIKYKIVANINTFEFGSVKLTFAEKIRQRIKECLNFGLSNENAELTYSALFGDKTNLYESNKEAFKLAGVAHLLAVSGLHVGIIVAIFDWLCKKLKLNKWVKLVIIGSLLLFYMYICDFSASIVRASIMSIMLMLAPIFNRKYDSLSAIGFAGIICYLIDPLFAFDAGGTMSFACVTGINLLYPSIYSVLAKTTISNKIAQSLSISASTMISLLFIMAYYFQTLNLISILANIVLIPLFTVGFIVSFVVGFLGLISRYIGILLVPVNYLFSFINIVAHILGNLSFANFETVNVHYISIVIYMIILLLMSNKTTAKPAHKTIVILPLVAILFALML